MKHFFYISFTLLYTFTLTAQNKKFAVVPFTSTCNVDDKTTYYLSYLFSDVLTATGRVKVISQDTIFDKLENKISAHSSSKNLDLLSTDAVDVVVSGKYCMHGDSIEIEFEILGVNRQMNSPQAIIVGSIKNYTDFYKTMLHATEKLFEQINYVENGVLEQNGALLGRERLRTIASDHEEYALYVQKWTALGYYALGVSAFEKNKDSAAVLYFQKARRYDYNNTLNSEKNLSATYLRMGNTAYRNSDWPAAITSYNHAIEFQPENADAVFNLGNVYQARKEWDVAVLQYRRVLELSPKYIDAWVNLGLVFSEKGSTQEALVAYESALKIDSLNAWVHYGCAVGYDDNSDYTKAEQHYRKAVALDSSLYDAYLNLGILLKRKKQNKEAQSMFNKSLALNPGNAKIHRSLGIVYMNDKKQAKKAVYHLEQALVLDPSQRDAEVIRKNINILKKRLSKK